MNPRYEWSFCRISSSLSRKARMSTWNSFIQERDHRYDTRPMTRDWSWMKDKSGMTRFHHDRELISQEESLCLWWTLGNGWRNSASHKLHKYQHRDSLGRSRRVLICYHCSWNHKKDRYDASIFFMIMSPLHIVHKKLIITGIIFLLSWVIGTMLIHHFEKGYPIGESYFNALYFTVITTATIGFWDLVPMTVAGKVITMGYAIFYVPLFLYVMTVLFQSSLQKVKVKDELLEQEIHHTERDVDLIINESPKKKYIAKK